jgi:hypothetical protein
VNLRIDEQDQKELVLLLKVARFDEIHRLRNGGTQRAVALSELQDRVNAAR